IQKLRGRVDIRSERGKGATFSLRLPLTLALVETLVTCVGEHRFLIPLAAVREVLKPSAGMLSRLQDRVEVVLVRDKVLPLVRIHRKLRLGGRHRPVEEGLIVVLEVESQRFCISVDQLLGKEEVVIKSLGHTLAQIRSYAGGAILSDGTVGLLLEPEELCVLSGSESP
ncbi:MAG TPA: chemotaxis protein CheW, partial [Bryobacteraceae bacterium]|nr:chemotaxis protein CheW [Bryobacteraceae bacterium]